MPGNEILPFLILFLFGDGHIETHVYKTLRITVVLPPSRQAH